MRPRAALACHGREDRALVVPHGDGLILLVADGAGGTGRGAAAAEVVLEAVRAGFTGDPVRLLEECDAALSTSGGQTTTVMAIVDAHGVRGASVGDSGAWLIGSASHRDLTEHQRRKPLLGSGQAVVTRFDHSPSDGTLLLASDGLFKYAPAARICALARDPDLDGIPQRLVELVRLPSGSLPDDVAVIVCRGYA